MSVSDRTQRLAPISRTFPLLWWSLSSFFAAVILWQKRGSVDMFKSPHMMLYAQKDQLCCLPFRKLNALAPVDAPTVIPFPPFILWTLIVRIHNRRAPFPSRTSFCSLDRPPTPSLAAFASTPNQTWFFFPLCSVPKFAQQLSHSPQSRTRRSSSVSTPPQALQSSQVSLSPRILFYHPSAVCPRSPS